MNGKRKHDRYNLDKQIQLVFADGETHSGRSLNFCLGGMFVVIDPLPEFGSRVTLEIDLPGAPETCRIPCIVRWTKTGHGAGIQFEYTRPIEIWALSKLIRKIVEEEE